MRIPDPAVMASIPDRIGDGTVQPAPTHPALPEFKVKVSETRRIHVIKPPPMSGLPPVSGTITETVQLVRDPELPPPTPPPVSETPDSGETSRFPEMAAEDPHARVALVSATVYDQSRALLQCCPAGRAAKAITALSNLDFNHFSGFSAFRVTGKDGKTKEYGLIMGIGNEAVASSDKLKADLRWISGAPDVPALPDLGVAGPAFVVLEGEANNAEAMDLLEGMHALYRTEGKRMAEAHAARVKANKEMRAHLLANPPKPGDVTVRIWKRDTPTTKPPKGSTR